MRVKPFLSVQPKKAAIDAEDVTSCRGGYSNLTSVRTVDLAFLSFIPGTDRNGEGMPNSRACIEVMDGERGYFNDRFRLVGKAKSKKRLCRREIVRLFILNYKDVFRVPARPRRRRRAINSTSGIDRACRGRSDRTLSAAIARSPPRQGKTEQ